MKHSVVQWDRRDTHLRTGQPVLGAGRSTIAGAAVHVTDSAGVVHIVGNTVSQGARFIPEWFINSNGVAQGVI